MRPALALPSCTFGLLQLTWSNRLNASTRNSTRRPCCEVDVPGERQVDVPEARATQVALRDVAHLAWAVDPERAHVDPLQLGIEPARVRHPDRVGQIGVNARHDERPLNPGHERRVSGHRRRQRRAAPDLVDQTNLPVARDHTQNPAADPWADGHRREVEEVRSIRFTRPFVGRRIRTRVVVGIALRHREHVVDVNRPVHPGWCTCCGCSSRSRSTRYPCAFAGRSGRCRSSPCLPDRAGRCPPVCKTPPGRD